MSEAQATPQAAEQVAKGMLSGLNQSPADLLLVFATAAHLEGLPQAVSVLQQATGARTVLACSAEGVCGTGRELERQPGLSAMAGVLPGTEEGASVKPIDLQSPAFAEAMEDPGRLRALLQGGRDEPIRAMLLLADPFSTAMVKLLPALDAALPGVPIVGGMASAAERPGGNRLFTGTQWTDRGAAAVVIRGGIDVQVVVSQGCRPIGRPMVITKAHRNMVQELGGVNALEAVRAMVRQLSPELQEQLRQTPLLAGLVVNEYKPRFGRGDFVMRPLVVADADRGTLAIGDPTLRVGQTVQFHLRDAQTSKDDLEMLLSAQSLHGAPAGLVLMTCNGRGRRLFEEPDMDTGLIRRVLGEAPLAGMFAASEIGPIGNRSFVHGHTACLMILRPGSDASGAAGRST